MYKYRTSLYGHQNDVRDVCAYSTAQKQDIILSSSRDKTAKVWQQTELVNTLLFQQVQLVM